MWPMRVISWAAETPLPDEALLLAPPPPAAAPAPPPAMPPLTLAATDTATLTPMAAPTAACREHLRKELSHVWPWRPQPPSHYILPLPRPGPSRTFAESAFLCLAGRYRAPNIKKRHNNITEYGGNNYQGNN